MATVSDERLLASKILAQIISHKGSLASHLKVELKHNTELNYGLLQEYCYGVCRWYYLLNSWALTLLEKPLRNKDMDIHCLLLIGLYQLFFMRTPPHAAVNEAVSACEKLNKPWAKALINAVLREAQRSHEALLQKAETDYVSKYSHPQWLLDRLKQDWPSSYRNILDANNQKAPMTLRVNIARITRADYLGQLQAAGISATATQLTATALILATPVDVTQLPGFDEGLISVQDEASQLLPTLLPLAPGLKVLDVCAAPGGKTCALLEAEPALSVLCLDNDSRRLPRLQENLARGQHSATVQCADITQQRISDDGTFDLILLDAPCSATGVIRRHPDIKLLRTPKEVELLITTQYALLDAAWPLLKSGGLLLYSTCSVLKAENFDQIAAFIKRHHNVKVHHLQIPTAFNSDHGSQLFPSPGENDGFYYALLEKW